MMNILIKKMIAGAGMGISVLALMGSIPVFAGPYPQPVIIPESVPVIVPECHHHHRWHHRHHHWRPYQQSYSAPIYRSQSSSYPMNPSDSSSRPVYPYGSSSGRGHG